MDLLKQATEFLSSSAEIFGIASDIEVFKYDGLGPKNRYGQAPRIFKPAVRVRAIIDLNPNEEMQTQFGSNSSEFTGMVTILRPEILKSFPLVKAKEAFTVDDELLVFGDRMIISGVHLCGMIGPDCAAVVLTFSPEPENG